MKLRPGRRNFFLGILGVFTALLVSGGFGRAQYVYQLDDGSREEIFNNSFGDSDIEDNWVANSFCAVDGGTHLVSITFQSGQAYTDRPISAFIYSGSDLFDPTAGGGLVLVTQTDTTYTGTDRNYVTITLDTPVDLNVGDIFYAALLLRKVPGSEFPFSNDTNTPFANSFYDVGPTGENSDWDVNQGSANITVFGGRHPVIGGNIQSAGNLILRVNATTP